MFPTINPGQHFGAKEAQTVKVDRASLLKENTRAAWALGLQILNSKQTLLALYYTSDLGVSKGWPGPICGALQKHRELGAPMAKLIGTLTAPFHASVRRACSFVPRAWQRRAALPLYTWTSSGKRQLLYANSSLSSSRGSSSSWRATNARVSPTTNRMIWKFVPRWALAHNSQLWQSISSWIWVEFWGRLLLNWLSYHWHQGIILSV
jgi:hypothetical protein